MDKFNKKLGEFFAGRNGVDELGRLVMLVACVLCMCSIFFRVAWLNWIAELMILYAIFRILSTNLVSRRAENAAYHKLVDGIRVRLNPRSPYRYYKCTSCGKTLRVPKGKGKIEITCPQCHNKMIRKS